MNILYLSHLEDMAFTGPNYSVPSQIKAQSKMDNVFWYNTVRNDKKEWRALPYYHNLEEYPQKKIDVLPAPFNKPDLVIVEGFYNMTTSKLLWELRMNDHPYIIIPRGELTYLAQARKSIKKRIANLLICKPFAQKALAIQYLTEQERIDSSDKKWNKNYLVIPNGITTPLKRKDSYSQKKITCISIGRMEPYQKGLDLLIEACGQIKNSLKEANCEIHLYGPDNENKKIELLRSIAKNGLEKAVFLHEAVFGDDKENALLAGDVFLMPSRFEGHPMALIEALAYGLPCIATTGSNMFEEIRTERAGWPTETTAEGIKNAILQMIEQRERLSEYGQNAIKLAKRYDWDTIAQISHERYKLHLSVKG